MLSYDTKVAKCINSVMVGQATSTSIVQVLGPYMIQVLIAILVRVLGSQILIQSLRISS